MMTGTGTNLVQLAGDKTTDLDSEECERRNMKIKWLLCVILAGCTFGFAKDKAEVRDVTGCLSKGDSTNEFLLTGTDGSTWEVRSSKVALAEH